MPLQVQVPVPFTRPDAAAIPAPVLLQGQPLAAKAGPPARTAPAASVHAETNAARRLRRRVIVVVYLFIISPFLGVVERHKGL